jgi:hypothetical protein
MRGSPQEQRESLFRRSGLSWSKTQDLGYDGIVFELKNQIGQRCQPPKVLIDKSPQDGIFRKRRTPGCFGQVRERGQVFKKLFISDSGREIFGFEKRDIFHGTLEFRDGQRKMATPRVSERPELGELTYSF